MALVYIICALIVMLPNIGTIPKVFGDILEGAFNPQRQ